MGKTALITGVLVMVLSSPAYLWAGAGEEDVQEVVVTATRIETPIEEVASSITVITAEDIQRKGARTVLEALEGVPGIKINVNGGPGQTATVFIRGAKSGHTLVLIDGVEVNDPISTGRIFNFANLTTDNIERIEVLRGPQSPLYGSDAIGGVINIITRRGRGKPHVVLTGETGSFGTIRGAVEASGGTGRSNYSLSLSHFDTDGISAADERDGNTEKDGYTNTTWSGKVGIEPSDSLALDLIFRYSDAKADLDNFGGAFGDDPDHVSGTKELIMRGQGTISLAGGAWEQIVGISYTDNSRNDINPPNRSEFDSGLVKLDWQNNLYLSPVVTLTVGAESGKERGKTDTFAEKKARTTGIYFLEQNDMGGRFITTVGARIDDHSDFGTQATYRLTAAYLLHESGTRFRATYGTGFKAPSLYQLFSIYGDPGLQPEESGSWDVGADQDLMGGRASLGLTYFDNRFDNLIDFDFGTMTYQNTLGANTSGLEFISRLFLTDSVELSLNYTYTRSEDEATGEKLLRVPRDSIGFTADYSPSTGSHVGLDILYVGDNADLDFPPPTYTPVRVTLDGYTLVNLSGAFSVAHGFEITGRVENLLDEDYQTILGYGTPGISGYLGFRADL